MRDWYQPPVILSDKPAVEVEEWGLSWSRVEAEAIRKGNEDLMTRFEMHEPRSTACYTKLKAAIAKPVAQGKLETERDRKADKLLRDSMSNMMAIALALDKAPQFVTPDVLIPDLVECIRQLKTARTWLAKAPETGRRQPVGRNTSKMLSARGETKTVPRPSSGCRIPARPKWKQAPGGSGQS
jgi:hypothetical protein